MRRLREIYVFTLQQQLKIKTVRVLTVIIALIFFLVPSISMVVSELNSKKAAPDAGSETEELPADDESPESDDPYNADGIQHVFYTVETGSEQVKALFRELSVPGFEKTSFEETASLSEALEKGAQDPGSLVLQIQETENTIGIKTVLPENTALSYNKAAFLADTIEIQLPLILAEKAGISESGQMLLASPLMMSREEIRYGGDNEPSQAEVKTEEELYTEEVRSIIGMILPYVNIMLIYFLVLYYGQSAANTVILEKTSKLMDTFLVAVKPETMIMGKVLAEWTAALIQFLIWVVSLVLGFAAGSIIVRAINPASTLRIFAVFEVLKSASAMFSFPAILTAVLIIFGGLLLYCCMAAICASFASKPEELSSTIVIFTLTLVISMLITLRAGFLKNDMAEGAKWFDFVPFTAIMITPARLLLQQVSIGSGLISLGIILVLCFIFIRIAGRVYKMMSLYKGNVPKFKEILALLKE